MKRQLLLYFILVMVAVLPVAAQSLSVGDTIAIISPSSATDTATINGGVRTLQSWGFPCVVAPHALDDYRGFAGTADERLSDLLWALRAPHIRAIIPLLLPDVILFVEDTGEGISKVDRMLHNIELRGLMSHVRGIIVGQFTKYKHPDGGFEDMNDMFHEYLQRYDIPVCYDFPVGHSHLRNFPLPVGCHTTLVINTEGTTLTFTKN